MQSLQYTVCINNVQNCRLWIQSSYCRLQSICIESAAKVPIHFSNRSQLEVQSITATAAKFPFHFSYRSQLEVQSLTVTTLGRGAIRYSTAAKRAIHYSYHSQGSNPLQLLQLGVQSTVLKLLQLAMGTIHYSYGHQGCNLLQLTQLFSPLHLTQLQVHTVQSKSVTPFKGTVYCISVYC